MSFTGSRVVTYRIVQDIRTNPVKLRTLRILAGLTRAELADKAGVSRMSIYRTETGKTAPRLGTVRALAQALGVPVTQLLELDPDGAPR